MEQYNLSNCLTLRLLKGKGRGEGVGGDQDEEDNDEDEKEVKKKKRTKAKMVMPINFQSFYSQALVTICGNNWLVIYKH